MKTVLLMVAMMGLSVSALALEEVGVKLNQRKCREQQKKPRAI